MMQVVWLLVNGSLIRFGLGELAIMTRLKCNGVARENCISQKKNYLIDRCFPSIKNIIIQKVADSTHFYFVTSLKIKYLIGILKW